MFESYESVNHSDAPLTTWLVDHTTYTVTREWGVFTPNGLELHSTTDQYSAGDFEEEVLTIQARAVRVS